ncbi:glycosyltransferase family 4 protein [Persicobacter diffluens]|uniref:Glycosyltransferase n=1 Tax=Persicobacter diffluens TaxID=981 RepID=A0AAN4W1C9_9BACT|nr:hypothetical protein PEDI_40850 [Persicobacter diffluens]
MDQRKRVLIIQKSLPHYRIPFFEGLRTQLKDQNIELQLAYGKGSQFDQAKKDQSDLAWAIPYDNSVFHFLGKEFYWQPLKQLVKSFDLIIVEQANRLLFNYWLMGNRVLNNYQLAYWGHGLSKNRGVGKFSKFFKQQLLQQVDWWFAYTEGVKNFLLQEGLSSEKITVVDNAIDTKQFITDLQGLDSDYLEALQKQYGIGKGLKAIYCGGIYAEKKPKMLLEAVIKIRSSISDFEMMVIGAGDEAYIWKEAAEKHDFIHYLGAAFGKKKAAFFKMADVFLNPGLVGLAVLDSFAAECPMITQPYEFHSPEFSYLKHGINGWVGSAQTEDYSNEVIQVLQDASLLNQLKAGCRAASTQFTIENMIENFALGISLAINR